MDKWSLIFLAINTLTFIYAGFIWPFIAMSNPIYFGWMPSMLLSHLVIFTIWIVSWGLYLYRPKRREAV